MLGGARGGRGEGGKDGGRKLWTFSVSVGCTSIDIVVPNRSLLTFTFTPPKSGPKFQYDQPEESQSLMQEMYQLRDMT